MPVYKITTPTGEVRVIEAPVQKSALNHVVKSEYQVEALSAVQLSAVMREHPELEIEQVVAKAKDPNQAGIEGDKADEEGEE